MRTYIDRKINELTRKYKTNDPFELIDALGIHLIMDRDIGNLKGFYYVSHRERYIAVNPELHEREQILVAAHELGHDRLHRQLATVEPLKDFLLYDMSAVTEHDANTFAAGLLMSDQEVDACIKEEMDFFSMCATLGFRPEIVTFKIYSMMQRGYSLNLPQNINSKFLGR